MEIIWILEHLWFTHAKKAAILIKDILKNILLINLSNK